MSARTSKSAHDTLGPSYNIALRTHKKKHCGGPDQSPTYFSFSLIAYTGGPAVDDIAPKLAEVSPNAQERVAAGILASNDHGRNAAW